jgi:glycosyltransferase involved in cell wall biosynthesis
MIEHIDGFHALSPHVRDAYVDFGYERDKIDVIPNILDSQFDIKHISNFKEPINLLYVGALKKSKGIDRLIDVFSAVQERTELAVLLTIVGDGPFENDLRREIETKDLTELIEMRGHTSYNCLPSVYANHDLFLYPGRWDEPFGRVFLEAMATGTPIVTTDVGSANDIIGRAGKVTQMDNDSLIDGVLSALNYQLLQEYSEVGKRRIDQYRISEIVPRFEELYTGIF